MLTERKLAVARLRAEAMRSIRDLFSGEGYLEVETPILAPGLIPESNIASFRTRFASPFHPESELYLLPSPELWMKQLIAQGSGSIFQLSRCFRNAEQIGRIHNPEFTMLEWYTVGSDYLREIQTTERLFERLLPPKSDRDPAPEGDPFEDLRPPFRRLSMEEAFSRYAGIDLAACESLEAIEAAARAAGVAPPAEQGAHGSAASPQGAAGPVEPETWESLFNRIFVGRVEPALPQDRPLVLYNYPANLPSLSRRIPGTPWSERWELYARGCELANCYSEETDPDRISAFFAQEARRLTALGGPVRTEPRFPAIFGPSYPRSSGVALGVDRLVMLLSSERDIGGVILFPFSAILPGHSTHALK